MSFDTICVVGLGYIGLPTATMFASRRKKVIGVDTNQDVVDTINRGEIHIIEPELDIAVRAAVKEGYLQAVRRPEPADAFLVAVPTPFKKGQVEEEIPTPDLSYIAAAADSIAPVLKKGNLVILESTSPVGATEQMADWLAKARPDLTFPQQAGYSADVMVAHCPERVLPGRVMHELIENDRIIGGMTERCSTAACDLYKIFVRGECLTTSARTAEMAKLTENAFRDVNIAFANELSIICDDANIDVWELIGLANKHPRVNILQPGPGVGGHCIAVDPWFIASSSPDNARIIRVARGINDSKPDWVVRKVSELVSEFLRLNPNRKEADVTIACYGLTFKANIDDLRGSPALCIAQRLTQTLKSQVIAIEPNLRCNTDAIGEIKLMDFDTATDRADIFLLLVDHKEFKESTLLGADRRFLIDTRGIW
jgi:UDP-N-acetyl-D-mannosaminuronic acid dehydrogenase